MAINGMRATSEITPNESFVFPQPFAAPIVKESTNVEVNGPEATPPESNAIPVNRSGQNIIKTKAMTYPGIKMKRKLIPRIERHKESPIAIAVPTDKKTRRTFRLIVPPLTASTCSLKTQTAGSAQTIIAPSKSPVVIKMKYQTPPFLATIYPKVLPSISPACMNPPFTPVRNNKSPVKL